VRERTIRKTIERIIVLTAALYLAWVSGSIAQGGPRTSFRGTFEAPFVDVVAQVEVAGSEGKIGDEGQFKVEIETAQAATAFQICLVTANLAPLFLADAVSDEDGELKVESTLPLAPGTPTTLQAPRFQVLTGAPGTCGGTLVFETGLTVIVPLEGTTTGSRRSGQK
jgi:hypothetical protein